MRYNECFTDVQEPLYGFKVKVTIAENSPCTLGVTCRGDPVPSLDFGTAANQFSSRTSDDYNDLKEPNEPEDPIDLHYPNNLEDLDRQTGEEFFSEAAPDCRVTCS